jgi:hypothetical protein
MKLLGMLRGLFGQSEQVKTDSTTVAVDQAIAYLKLFEPGSGNSIELSEEAMPVMSPLVGDLITGYVIDIGPAFQFVQERDVRTAGIGKEALHRIGVANLSDKLSADSLSIQQMGEIYAVFLDQHFEASLMLVDRLWDEIMIEHLPGDVVAAVPWRDILIFCDASSAVGIENLKTQVELLDEGTHPLSKSLFRRDRVTKTWHVLGH